MSPFIKRSNCLFFQKTYNKNHIEANGQENIQKGISKVCHPARTVHKKQNFPATQWEFLRCVFVQTIEKQRKEWPQEEEQEMSPQRDTDGGFVSEGGTCRRRHECWGAALGRFSKSNGARKRPGSWEET